MTARDDAKTYCSATLISWHSEDENNPVVLRFARLKINRSKQTPVAESDA